MGNPGFPAQGYRGRVVRFSRQLVCLENLPGDRHPSRSNRGHRGHCPSRGCPFPHRQPFGQRRHFRQSSRPDRALHAAFAGAKKSASTVSFCCSAPCCGVYTYWHFSVFRSTRYRSEEAWWSPRPDGLSWARHRTSKNDAPAEDEILENAFYPFTLPITVGPGSISVAITLGAHLPPDVGEASLFSPRVLIAAIAGITSICLIIYLCYVYARKAEQLLGRSGTSMVMRLSSFILLCIGVQIICTGLKAYLQTIGKF